MLPRIDVSELKKALIQDVLLVDVRAPVEFNEGSIPGAINLPLLNDEERAKIGKTYKQQGREKAIALGYKIVSGEIKDTRIKHWLEALESHPESIVFCFRGGQRSQITQQWLADAGCVRPIIEGGYKKIRQELMGVIEDFSTKNPFIVVSGPTGSGKTEFLRSLSSQLPTLDFEKYANHRGSAFGVLGIQPTQINFENQMAVEILKIQDRWNLLETPRPVVIEDESRLIGARSLPESTFNQLRRSSIVWIEKDIEERVEQIFKEYILESAIGTQADITDTFVQAQYERYFKALAAIERRLGGLRTKEIHQQMKAAQLQHQMAQGLELHRDWIRSLLIYYYDPMYLTSLERRNPHIAYRGPLQECREYLLSLKNTGASR
ncbi:MAG: tRNA 2-selenouridine(34) synthase MnmH [Bdellovibrionia bacterium]